MRRVLANTSVVLCSVMSSASLSYSVCQMSFDITVSSGASGSTSARSRARTWPLLTMTQASSMSCCRRCPVRKLATASIGFCVADRPMRCGGVGVKAARRSSDSARCEPRLVPATAWISSTITERTVDSILRPESLVSSRYSDSGVVTRIWGARFRIATRSACAVSPVRTIARISKVGTPSLSSSARMPVSGSSRFLWMSFDSALSGET